MMMMAERLFTVFAKILILMLVIMITGMATVAMTIMLYLGVDALGRLESNPLSAHSSRIVTGLLRVTFQTPSQLSGWKGNSEKNQSSAKLMQTVLSTTST